MCFSCSTYLLVNIPFPSSTIFSSSPAPKLVSCHASPRLKRYSPWCIQVGLKYSCQNATSGSIAQCGNLHVCWHQTRFTIGRMQVWSSQSTVSLSLISFYTPDIFVHALSCCIHDFSCYTPPWSQDHRDGSLAAGTFIWLFLRKGRKEGSYFYFFSGCTIWLRIFSVILQQTLCPSFRRCCAIGVYLQCDETVVQVRILYVVGFGL